MTVRPSPPRCRAAPSVDPICAEKAVIWTLNSVAFDVFAIVRKALAGMERQRSFVHLRPLRWRPPDIIEFHPCSARRWRTAGPRRSVPRSLSSRSSHHEVPRLRRTAPRRRRRALADWFELNASDGRPDGPVVLIERLPSKGKASETPRLSHLHRAVVTLSALPDDAELALEISGVLNSSLVAWCDDETTPDM